jgi:hypothetical protein
MQWSYGNAMASIQTTSSAAQEAGNQARGIFFSKNPQPALFGKQLQAFPAFGVI